MICFGEKTKLWGGMEVSQMTFFPWMSFGNGFLLKRYPFRAKTSLTRKVV
jgi:hypothetical protein